MDSSPVDFASRCARCITARPPPPLQCQRAEVFLRSLSLSLPFRLSSHKRADRIEPSALWRAMRARTRISFDQNAAALRDTQQVAVSAAADKTNPNRMWSVCRLCQVSCAPLSAERVGAASEVAFEATQKSFCGLWTSVVATSICCLR